MRALSDLVRSMNCYYSNLIEGHDTQPIDIERALNEDYSTDPKKRDLQLEAKAHIAVQQWIDADGLLGTGDRNARRVTSALLERGVLAAASTRAPLRLNFLAALAGRWMPGLFPER
ncbi:MAG: hypothetical protein JG718_17270 [Candidatus Thiothrix moscowensis]|nr:hypothetical protein [Candidatus Thiothrix moscowensis]